MDALSRRHFLRTSGAVVGAALAQSMLFPAEASAQAKVRIPRIWNYAEILIGNSLADQAPNAVITCPMFLPSGHFANASHTLDLSGLPTGGVVKGDISWYGESISPDFSRSFAGATTTGTDGYLYLLTAAEGDVSGGEGQFRGVTRAIVRCKYKVVDQGGFPLLVACVHCVAILLRN